MKGADLGGEQERDDETWSCVRGLVATSQNSGHRKIQI